MLGFYDTHNHIDKQNDVRNRERVCLLEMIMKATLRLKNV